MKCLGQLGLPAAWLKLIYMISPTVMKGGLSPNAAGLLAGWLASAEGQKGSDQIGRGAPPFVEGTEKWKRMKTAGARPVFGSFSKIEFSK
ncbi:MAG: hypothetical protein ACREQW_12010 [Candidatus Binatia bacterium]